ncbi:hypothetical protein HII13_000216 [Brettanomyces bruxellensis]|nr:hypothetical protein HII13_000216 [Brettanomyces bruxellensis]
MFKAVAGTTALSLGAVSLFFWGRQSGSTQTASPGSPIGEFPANGGRNVPSKPQGTTNNMANPGADINPVDYFVKYGFPGPIHDLERHQEFVSVYDRRTRNPYYVVEHLTPASLQKGPTNGNRRNSFFKEDESIPEIFRSKLKDYFRSGYDRGHQAPAADAKVSQQAMDETFSLDKHVTTRPLFLPRKDPVDGKFRVSYEVIGNPPSVAVPTHFFKLVVAENSLSKKPDSQDIAVAAFVLPNGKIPNEVPLTSFKVPVEALERSSGLELLEKVPDTRKKDLCKEVRCEIIVRDFSNAAKSLPAPRK